MVLKTLFNHYNNNLNPWSDSFKASRADFADLHWFKKLTALAIGFFGSPFLVLGFSTFRLSVSILKPQPVKQNPGAQDEGKKVDNKSGEMESKNEDKKTNEQDRKKEADQVPKDALKNPQIDEKKNTPEPKKPEDQNTQNKDFNLDKNLMEKDPSKEGYFNGFMNLGGKIIKNLTNSTEVNKVVWKAQKYEEWNLQFLESLDESLKNKLKGSSFEEVLIRLENLKKKRENSSDSLLDFENLSDYRNAVKLLTKDVIVTVSNLLDSKIHKELGVQLSYAICSLIHLEQSSFNTLGVFHNYKKIENGEDTLDALRFADDEDFIDNLNQLFKKLNDAPVEFKTPTTHSYWNWWTAPKVEIQDGNLSNVSYELELSNSDTKKTVKSLKMASPTRSVRVGMWGSKEEFTPLFKGFLENCQKKGEKHLTVLYGDYEKSNPSHEYVLEESKNGVYKDTLHTIILSKETAFYKGENREPQTLKAFISSLQNEINASYGISIPSEIRSKLITSKEGFLGYLKNTLQNIGKKFFNDVEIIDKDLARKFIDIFYDTLTKDILIALEVNSFNIIEKNGIERSPCANASLYTHIAVTGNKDHKLTPAQQNKIAQILFIPALNATKNVISKENYEEFVKVEQVYLNFKNNVRIVPNEEKPVQKDRFFIIR